MNTGRPGSRLSREDDRPRLLLGGGGHSRVLIDALRLAGTKVIGIADPARVKGSDVAGIEVIGGDEKVLEFPADSVLLVNAIGFSNSTHDRARLFDRFKREGYSFAHVVHPAAVVAADAVLAEGAQAMAGVIVQPGCMVGEDTILNTRASVDHDCAIGRHVHIAPGAVLCGGVHVGASSHIGAGATIIQNIRIGSKSIVAAGAVVICDVADNSRVAGVPAREI